MRLCLKHLRQFEYTAFNMLQKKAKVQLEHPTTLSPGELREEERGGKGKGGVCMYVRGNWMCLQVEKGDFVASERVLEQATEGKPHTICECLLQ